MAMQNSWREGGMHLGVCKIQVARYASGPGHLKWAGTRLSTPLSTQTGGYVCFFSACRDGLRLVFYRGRSRFAPAPFANFGTGTVPHPADPGRFAKLLVSVPHYARRETETPAGK